MVADTLVDNKIDEGSMLLDRLAENEVVVRAACWVKPVEDDRWSLYIVTPAMDREGPVAAYGRVLGALRSLRPRWLKDSDIKLLGEKQQAARDVLDESRRLDTRVHFHAPLLIEDVPIECIYIYPIMKIDITVYGLIYRGDPSRALHLSLEPHNPNSKMEEERDGKWQTYPAEVGHDWLVAAPEGSTQERDDLGLMVLSWNLRGRRIQSGANEVWSFAKLGMHGFRFLSEPDRTEGRSRLG
jgi:hypothetical protein